MRPDPLDPSFVLFPDRPRGIGSASAICVKFACEIFKERLFFVLVGFLRTRDRNPYVEGSEEFVGFALLIPPVRAALKRGLASRFKAQAAVQFQMGRAPGCHRPDSSSNDTIIDAEVLHRSTDED